MKNRLKKWAFPVIIFIISVFLCTFSKAQNNNSFMFGMPLPWGLDNLLKRIFLYTSEDDMYFSGVNFFHYINLMAIVIFGTCHITSSMYGVSRKYRSLIMMRYKNKSAFINYNQKRGLISCIAITAAVFLGVSAGYIITACGKVDTRGALIFALLIINMFIYFNIIVIFNIFCVFILGEIMSLTIVVLLGMIIILIDIRITAVSIVTYGNAFSLFMGLTVLAVIYLILNCFVYRKIKNMDVL